MVINYFYSSSKNLSSIEINFREMPWKEDDFNQEDKVFGVQGILEK